MSDRDYRLTLPSLRVRTALSDVQRAHGPGPPHTLRADLKKRAAKAGRLMACTRRRPLLASARVGCSTAALLAAAAAHR